MKTIDRLFRFGLMLMALALFGCVTNGGPSRSDNAGGFVNGKVDYCKQGDTQVSSQSACLQDDAACYKLKNGKWCTGPRGAACPTGSTPLPDGTTCPSGAKCFESSPGLNCRISLN